MRRFKVLTLLLVLLLILSSVSYAKDIEISGSLNSYLVGNPNNGLIEEEEKVNLILEKEFGFDANMHLDLEFKSDANSSTTTSFNEAYLNYYTQNMDWRLGKQEISWGSAYKINPTSYFNPNDLTALKPLDEKLGVKAIKGIYYAPKGLEITGVVVPFFRGISLKNNAKDNVGDNVKNIQSGFKVTKRRFHDYDISLSAYHGRDKLPAVDSKANFIYPKANRVGLDIIGDLGDMGVWAETTYSDYQDEQFKNVIETAVGIDYKFDNNLYLVGQGYYKEGRTESEPRVKAANFYVSKPIFDFHEIEVTTLYDFESETSLIEPQFNYSLANSVELQLGGTYVDSAEKDTSSGLISALGQDRIYTRLNVEF
ncbi:MULTISPECIES: hypothetical protein [unclassified Candidatus Frackibacter]|uniref:hypothetical protein n=1 Tax=unclassified Candidatus Frackibacter TaxID=2648818 RepID=UPI00088D2581|nr:MULTISPECIES: hypothetical protein [unclassified Candidatus Frackibacter]SDC01576.1 hypothetical protein SAMN04515661_101289 [Candidatus Frackibacter sp. WG11]SEM32802.1 hypothetical protein SAMN04488698_101289 [Candidatus Frackibacter sp. WG12]SFL37771.1 hypothetical protein SAMN04488699_101288 [Candidatus Frackibacter sp. WG13]